MYTVLMLTTLICIFCLVLSGTAIKFRGQQVGIYIDDTTPNRCQTALLDKTLGEFIIVGKAPNGPPCKGVLNAQEWYPYDCRYPAGTWGKIPKAEAYILQRHFAWPGCKPPTRKQQRALLRAALAQHPKYIFWY